MQTQSETQPTDPVAETQPTDPVTEPAPAEGQAKGAETAEESGADPAKPAKAGEKRKRREGPARPRSRRRGPPRPHRKLSDEVLHTRMEKLRKRAEKASDQLEETERHIVGYEMEVKYRILDMQQPEEVKGEP